MSLLSSLFLAFFSSNKKKRLKYDKITPKKVKSLPQKWKEHAIKMHQKMTKVRQKSGNNVLTKQQQKR